MAETIELGDFLGSKPKKSTKKKLKKKTSDSSIRKRPTGEEVERKKKKKPSSWDEDSTPKKKKKKKPSTDLAEVAPKKKKKKKRIPTEGELMERANSKGEAVDLYSAEIEQIQEERPAVKENAQFQEYVTMFNKLKRIARIKEEQCLDGASSKDIYALMQIYNQMRDIIADLRALKDITMAAADIEEEVIGPFAQQAAAALMKFFQSTKNQAQKDLSDDKLVSFLNQLKKYAKESGLDLQDALDNANESVFRVLSEQ